MNAQDGDILDLAPFLDALVSHVPFDGWSTKAIAAARADADPAADIGARLPTSATEAIRLWSELLDRRMADSVADEIEQVSRVRDKVILCVRRRLELMDGQQEAARRAAVTLAMPQNGLLATRCLHRTVDRIWHLAGDTSTDHNYYTKRGLLAPVYAATLLYWIGDASEGHGQTWSFLERRIDDVLKMPSALSSLRGRLPPLTNPLDVLRQFRDGRPRRHRR